MLNEADRVGHVWEDRVVPGRLPATTRLRFAELDMSATFDGQDPKIYGPRHR